MRLSVQTVLCCFFISISYSIFAQSNPDHDGSMLWFTNQNAQPEVILNHPSWICVPQESATFDLVKKEVTNELGTLCSTPFTFVKKFKDGSVFIGSVENETIRKYIDPNELKSTGDDGFIIRSFQSPRVIMIAANTDKGALYGTYHYIRLLKTSNPSLDSINIVEKPSYQRRILNHWDNLDGTVERGYAGHSLWKWDELPGKISPRYEQYARANASIGINGTVLNNVNANPDILSLNYLKKVKVLADIFRPYGIRVYLSVNFSSPKELGGLDTSDPLDEKVAQWWKDKADEIYSLIPDFGGFLVKANSEGLPGPQDYGRTHADGANMLAEALEPHHGIVMWRAFVYNPDGDDRAKQAYKEFVPLDGQFHKNVIIQVKNGPVDFQPREPFSPLFGAMRHTTLMPELQITQEYLGFSDHLAYLGTMFEESLDADTYVDGRNSTVARITNGDMFGDSITAIAGVANIGEDANWCGHHFAQANWWICNKRLYG
ncbi:alpha-glucuronidase family glycosyl hydrolase [Mangrovibacterium sp.]|uniref:alpha-glucuronidase family glycosyl hydrolase n=1 Tax=Mangrovibacterium sp. TaxID=1961364 RepID=UPI003566B845